MYKTVHNKRLSDKKLDRSQSIALLAVEELSTVVGQLSYCLRLTAQFSYVLQLK